MITEHQEQVAFVKWFKKNFPTLIIYAIPNGGKRSAREGKRFKDEGVLAGVSDLCILLPNGLSLYVEMKNEIGSLSESQNIFFENLDRLKFDYFIAYSATEASKEFINYLKFHKIKL